MLLRTVYQPDETLHSFIFRVCMINGVEQFANLTDNKGNWRLNLKLNTQIRVFFMSYSDQDILTLCRNAGLIKKNTHTFGNPLEYMSVLKNLYSIKGNHNISGSHPIGFCIYCIRDSLKVNGYGYFRTLWMQKWINTCNTHKKSLTFCPALPAKRSHEVIKQILRGEYPTGCYSDYYFRTLIKETPPLNYVSINEISPGECNQPDYIYIATCLKNAIRESINSSPEYHSYMSSVLDYYRDRKRWRPYRNFYSIEDYEIAVMIKVCFRDRYRIFLDFWHNNAKAITLYGGIFEHTEVSERFYIYQGMNKCGSCCNLDCPAKVQ
ncbi:TPA: TniQ family protein [Enterobacter chuandaensis]|uniref:hypothetical protein n=1 Tax=Enterobacter nematophilus TaxID=2994648 RepID=UPI0032F70133|nr:TniQ family protein [Enterobacter chuandaensis]